MSCRPIPVTATFPPLPLNPLFKSENLSLSSSSTASLLSILDHDSFESPEISKNRDISHEDSKDAEECKENRECKENIPITTIRKNNVQRNKSTLGTSEKTNHQTSQSRLSNISTEDRDMEKDKEMSAWERWVIRKAKENRSMLEKKMQQQRKAAEEQAKIEAQKEAKRLKANEEIQKWVKDYDESKKREIKLEIQKKKKKEEEKEQEQKKTFMKSQESYQDWMEKKAAAEIERKLKEKELKEREKRQKAEKVEKNEKAFQDWCEKAKNRPKTAPNSYGFSAGKLKGYYDSGAYPSPGYINPIPWRPVDIPLPTVPKKKNIRRARSSNSIKYF